MPNTNKKLKIKSAGGGKDNTEQPKGKEKLWL